VFSITETGGSWIVKKFKPPRIGGSLIPKFLKELNWGYSQNQIQTRNWFRVETSTPR
jgi:hypothetical protein